MKTNDPYNDIKLYHKAKLIGDDGSVSPLCAEKPRKLNLEKELWTTDDKAVTCRKCIRAIAKLKHIFRRTK